MEDIPVLARVCLLSSLSLLFLFLSLSFRFWQCTCKSFYSGWSCSCGQPWADHETVFETREERLAEGRPVDNLAGGGLGYAAMGGLMSFSSLVDGSERIGDAPRPRLLGDGSDGPAARLTMERTSASAGAVVATGVFLSRMG